MWKKFTDFLNHPIIQLAGGGVVVGVITWIVTHAAKLPLWEIWLAVLFAVGSILWIINQIAVVSERSKKRITKFSDKELESTIRQWIDNPGMAVTRLPNEDKIFFAFSVEFTDNKTKIVVSRMKSDSQFIAIQSAISIADVEGVELSEKDLDKVSRRVGLELARAGVYFAVSRLPKGIGIRMFNWVPLYDELNAGAFLQECLNVTKGVVLMRYALASALEELGKAMKPISHKEGSQS